jgi:hypothetical protein
MRYGIVFWGNSPDAKRIFLLQKRAVRVMIGLKQRDMQDGIQKTKHINIGLPIHCGVAPKAVVQSVHC